MKCRKSITVNFNLLIISPEFLKDQKKFLPDRTYTFSQYLMTRVSTAVRQEVNNIESSAVAHELV